MKDMVFENQTEADVMFVDWGKLKEGHKKESCVVVKEGEYIDGKVLEIRHHDVFTFTYHLECKGYAKAVVLLGNSALNRQMMGIGLSDAQLKEFNDKDKTVKVGNKVRVWYNGMYTTEKGGNKGYSIRVEVDREK